MEERKHTNKTKLIQGLKTMAGALPLLIIGPVILFSSFKNEGHPWFIPVLIVGLLAMIASVYLLFKGIRTIMNSLFDK